jgi:hypothetical protein
VKENEDDQQDFSRARRSAHPWLGVPGFGRQQQTSGVRQQPRHPSVMLLEDGAQVRGPAVNGYAIEENYIDKQNVWK